MEEVADGLFRWPVRPDVSRERLGHVNRILRDPVLNESKSSTRVQYYSFA